MHQYGKKNRIENFIQNDVTLSLNKTWNENRLVEPNQFPKIKQKYNKSRVSENCFD